MKKLSCLLIPMALSTTLFAQSNSSLSLGNEAFATAASELAWPVQSENESATSLQILDSPDNSTAAQTVSGPGPGPKPSKRRNFNRGYTVADALSYNTSIGVRVGAQESGLSAKYFFTKNTGVEAQLATSWHYSGSRLTALYVVQKHMGQDGFYWFWGIGAHAGAYNDNYWHKGECWDGSYEQGGTVYDCDEYRSALGVSAMLGVEYHFTDLPFTAGVDLKPSYDVLGRGRQYGDIALSIRYAF